MGTRPRTERTREQDRTAQRRYYDRNKQKVLDRNKAQQGRVKAAVAAAKDHPCADCGKSFPPCVMDFDHVRGNKRDNVASLVAANYGVATVMAEIAKCDLVCANCHRIRTHENRPPGPSRLRGRPDKAV